jgi:hypothetical protein
MSEPTENEMVREARRVLRKLAPPRSRLVPLDDGGWAVVQRGDPESGRTKATAAMVAAFRRRGWIERGSHSGLVLSEVGRSWIVADTAGVDAFVAQHQLLGLRLTRDEAGEECVVVVNEGESPLGWLKARGTIDEAQFEAGERLRRDYTLAGLEPRLGIDLSTVRGSGAGNAAAIPDSVLAAKERFSRALSAVGPGLSDLLFDVCCALRGLPAAEADKGWPKRSGKVVLGLALDRLATHYGLRRGAAPSRVRGWSADFAEAASG